MFKYLLCMAFFLATTLYGENVVRATVDIGSGATKLRVAEVNLKEHKIEKILATKTFSVQYQERLAASPTHEFDEQVMQSGLQALKQAADIAKEQGATQVIAVATQAFRKAHNAEEFMQRIYDETGIKVFVIDQDLEGELAFQATTSQLGIPAEKLLVWDIGGGSLQLTTVDKLGRYHIYRGTHASVPFKNHIIRWIQKKELEEGGTPNPLNISEAFKAQAHARSVASQVDALFKQKIQQPHTQVVGVGNIFGLQLYEMFGKKNTITRDELIEYVAELIHKSDEQVGGGPFANVYVSNTILVLGFMEQLGIEEMEIADINPADGAFFYAPFWDKEGAFKDEIIVDDPSK